ncbi:MAG: aminotransferase class IV [Acidimicrobiia bacterium]|nr:aminotransferase class IV [Acidimicrobiia bacterium]NNL28128.1 aminotransferase class IV [Acidimicrobiia bacterium]
MSKTHQALRDDRNESVLIYVNGDLLPRADAKVSVFDSAFLVGDGVWEGIRLHEGKLAFVDRHFDRLYAGAKAIDLDIGMTRAELRREIDRTLEANDMTTDVHIRLMVTRGTKKTPSQHPDLIVGGPTVVIIAEHKAADPAVTTSGIRLFTSTVRRPGPEVLDQRLNCHSKLHEVIALIQAYKAGADEALMLDPTGHVATCNSTNFFIVKGGEVWTSTGEYCLNGITRGLVIELAAAEAIPSFEKPFSLTDVYAADEAFVTGTFGALTPVIEVDGRTIGEGGTGPITSQLAAAYRRLIHAL